MLRKWILKYAFLIAIILFPTLGFAIEEHTISPALIPSSADVGQVQKQLEGGLAPPMVNSGKIPSPKTPQKENKIDASLEKIHIQLTQVKLTGNTVFSNQELLALFKSDINKNISLAHLNELVDNITEKYRKEGYVLSRAILPPQEISHGVVHVQIIEGFISQINITGTPGNTKPVIEKFGNHIMQSRPFQIHVLERDILLMNDIPGLAVQSYITPSKTVPAGAELTLAADRKRASAYMTYDNYGTRYIGPQEISVSGSIYSYGLPGDSNSFRYSTTPHNTELQYDEFTHTQPIGTSGLRLTIDGNYTETQPRFILTPLNIQGRSSVAYASLAYPYIRSRTKNLFFNGTFNYQNVSSTILGAPFYNDLLRTLDLGISLDGVDSWYGSNNASLDFQKGFDIWGAIQHVLQSRPKGVPNFSKFTFNLSRLQSIGTSRYTILAAMQSQYSFNPLLASEQYGYGGPEFGRGYDPSEIIGDQALAGKIEFQMLTSPELRFLHNVQYYVFYDAGKIWNRDGFNLLPQQSATSTGLGARFVFMPHLNGNFYIAKPLTKKVATLQAIGQNGYQFRTFFQLVASI